MIKIKESFKLKESSHPHADKSKEFRNLWDAIDMLVDDVGQYSKDFLVEIANALIANYPEAVPEIIKELNSAMDWLEEGALIVRGLGI
jgi:hypothetical protein